MVIKQLVAAVALLGQSVVAAPSLDISASVSLNWTNTASVSDRPTKFWYSSIDHNTRLVRGFAPDLDGDLDYDVFKAVRPGEGASIQAAINSGTNGAKRHGLWFASQPRVVYIPPGTYEISETIFMNTDTILMGDATDRPVIKASSSFSGDQTLISGQDPATGGSGELSFAVSLKNLILDTTSIPGGQAFTALWWGVAQGAQWQNVKIRMAPAIGGKGHSGIRLGRGSTLGISDVRIENGQNGIWYNGHQQAVFKSIYFYQNAVGMLIDGGATISLVNPTFDGCGMGVYHVSGNPWIGLIDATSINSGTTLKTTNWPNYLVENLRVIGGRSKNTVEGPGEFVLGSRSYVAQLSYGNTVGRNPIYGPVETAHLNRPSALTAGPDGGYPYLPAPNYADLSIRDFLNIKDPLQNGGYLYRVDSTLSVPSGSRIVGEAWATITGYGPFFKDSTRPQPIIKFGNPGEVGTAHIQDMRFTVSDVLPGAIIVQFNLAGSKPGDVAMWNSLVTVGGTRGAKALTDKCVNPKTDAPCKAAFLGIHLASTSSPLSHSVYLENVWNWVADHIAEEPLSPGGSNIAGKGGVLVEATKGTWLHALGAEHWWLYQLNLRKASNVLVTMLQSETNYDQGDNAVQVVPHPWTPDVEGWGDPDFTWCEGQENEKRCRMGFANYINGGRDIRTYATASWAFFSGPGYQSCAGQNQCQRYMHWVEKTPANLQAFWLCSKDTWATLRLEDGTDIVTKEGFTGSWSGSGGDVGRYTPEAL
ncbi:pectin lyase fold/virulence factor [Pseudoneurospora amorphoporcata]|uniref:Pectin lyase fold/virulence factor n=1 Tax=Pseudoneurospora amorphoporcata TaxID=241081 RepID=A0AAN6NNM6_9PEZI|nr:pectin lyase fold/virulence factor [Pseudoneurospora amorphoporcata]